jgi:ATP synthase F1 gamma subunit
MPTVKQLQSDIKGIDTIKSLSGAILEISALRIHKIKRDFEHNQEFFDEVRELYGIVKQSATYNQSHLPEKERSKSGNDTVAVAITSNGGFYGLLNIRVTDSFIDYIGKKEVDCIVIGSIGKRYMERSEHYDKCKFLTFKKDYPTTGETQVFLNNIAKYKHVYLFYPKFVSIFEQESGVIDITHAPEHTTKEEKRVKHIFEPELPKIVQFFETQVRHLLFMRIMLEAELARLSARLVKMSTTEERAENMILEKSHQLKKEIAILNDVKLLESFSGIKQWVK